MRLFKKEKEKEISANELNLNEAYLYLQKGYRQMQIDNHFSNKNNMIFIERIYSYLKFWENKIEEKGLKILKYENDNEFGFMFMDIQYIVAKLSFNKLLKEISLATYVDIKEYNSFYHHINYFTIKFVKPNIEIITILEKYEHYIDCKDFLSVLLNKHIYRFRDGNIVTEEHYKKENLESKKCHFNNLGYKSYEEANYLLSKKGKNLSRRSFEKEYRLALKKTKERS